MEEQKQIVTKKMEDNLESFRSRLRKMRTGRAQISLLEGVKILYYGSLTPLTQVAIVSTPSSRSFVVTPFDLKSLKDIEQALVKANLGLTPQNDGKLIRLTVPELTEERRKDMVKEIKKEAEKCRVDIRSNRRLANEEIKKLVKDKALSEDGHKQWGDDIQKITDKFMAQLGEILEAKEKDILEV